MPVPVTETVKFNVNVQCFEVEGKWIAATFETAIITVGDSEEEAMAAAERWNVRCVAMAKENGRTALERFLRDRGIDFEPLADDSGPEGSGGKYAKVAAFQNVPLASTLGTSGHVALAA